MLSNCRSTRCFLGPEGINSSREAKVRFPTDTKLKTDNREAEQGTHTASFSGRMKEHPVLPESRESSFCLWMVSR